MNLQAVRGNHAVKLLKATFADWREDKALRLSAALAYYSIFSIAPLLVIAISISGLLFGDEAARGHLDNQLRGYIGTQAAESVQSMVQSASKPAEGWTGAIVGSFILMLGASGVFGQLKDALNTIWEVETIGGAGVWGFVRARLLNFGMVLVIGFLLMTSLLLTTAMAAMSSSIEHLIGIPPVVGAGLAFVISLGMVTTLFAFIFKVLPDADIAWRHVWAGAFVTALLFEIGKFGLSYYLGRESTASSFGAAGAVVLLLLWVYYASCILLFGAEFTQVFARETGQVIAPMPGAVSVTAEARAKQGLVPAEAVVALAAPTAFVESPTPERSERGHPVGMLFAVTGVAYVVGQFARRHFEKGGRPGARIREGFADLGGEAMENVADLLKRVRDELRRHLP